MHWKRPLGWQERRGKSRPSSWSWVCLPVLSSLEGFWLPCRFGRVPLVGRPLCALYRATTWVPSHSGASCKMPFRIQIWGCSRAVTRTLCTALRATVPCPIGLGHLCRRGASSSKTWLGTPGLIQFPGGRPVRGRARNKVVTFTTLLVALCPGFRSRGADVSLAWSSTRSCVGPHWGQ